MDATSTAQLDLSPQQLRQLFPFYLVVDEQLQIVDAGPSLARICPDTQGEPTFTDVFIITRPTGSPSLDWLLENTSSLFLLRHRNSDLVLRGQFVGSETGDRGFFLGSPWLTDPKEMASHGLKINDFALHDPVVDFQQVVQALRISLDDTKRLATKLDAERSALREARSAAESGSRAKSIFLANMSHEIRTPMNGVVGLVDALLRSDLDDQQRGFLELVSQSADALLVILNDILDFSKIEAGKLVLEKQSFSFRQSLEQMLKPLEFRASEKGLEFPVQIADTVPDCLVGDPSRIRQILVNIIGNALKFTTRGRVALSVDLESSTDAEVVLAFEVSDTGVGIPAEQQDEIFEAFSQAEGSSSREHGGTGLGLAISRQLVKLMGGTITVASEPGRGTTFRFSVTCLRDAGQRSERSEDGSDTDQAQAAPLAPMKVLLAEDSKVNQLVASHLLEERGHHVVAVGDGKQALAAATRESFDLILMDVQMPRRDGFEATSLVRAHQQIDGKHTPIIAMTANAMKGDREKCLEAGMDEYLAKPVRAEELFKVIARVMAQTRGSSSTSDSKDN